jgi:hypothetical protein
MLRMLLLRMLLLRMLHRRSVLHYSLFLSLRSCSQRRAFVPSGKAPRRRCLLGEGL